ncbi:MAG: MFS transporter [Proteobacteria bacterium]|nr:MFS transporter [Pseudomonadota bacterium]
MTPGERRATFSLAAIYALRMLGLFLILPVFALYAHDHLDGSTPMLIGLAIGAYGLSQAVLQIPFGMLSDRIGRKPVIIAGLLIFAVGSVVAALADSITGVIVGRVLQGSGAIAAAVMALAADLTREEHRTKAMGVIGMTIGVSFALALIAGPVLNGWIGVPGIFWLTAVLALGGIAVLRFGVPQTVESHFHRDTETMPVKFMGVLKDVELLRLNFGILVLHAMLTASFVALPFALRDQAGLAAGQHWQVYFPVLVIALVLMVPFIIVAEKKRRMKEVFVGAIALLGLSQLTLLLMYDSVAGITLALLMFFISFNVLEASLPSLISKAAPVDGKGTALGIYSTSQFLGAFIGGIAGGTLYGAYGYAGVFTLCAVLAGVWAAVASTMASPRYLKSHLLKVGSMDDNQARALTERIRQVPGVVEVVVAEGTAYLKVDTQVLDEAALSGFSK